MDSRVAYVEVLFCSSSSQSRSLRAIVSSVGVGSALQALRRLISLWWIEAGLEQPSPDLLYDRRQRSVGLSGV